MAGAIGIALLLFAYGSFTWRGFVDTVGVCPRLFCDLVDYYYPMGEAVFRTGVPLEGFLYSPFTAIWLAILPMFGLDVSLVVWGGLQVGVVLLNVWLFRRLVPAQLWIQLLFVALTLFSYPLWLNFLAGNTSLLITVALVGMVALVERGRTVAAAVLLALAVSFKFYPIMFLAPFVAGRQIRLVAWAAVTCSAVLVVIPGVALGAGQMLDFYGALIGAFRDSGWMVVNPHSQFFPHFALRLAGLSGTESPIALSVLYAVSYGVAAVNLCAVYFIQRRQVVRANLWSVLILFLTTPFVLKTSWPIDFAYLPFVQAFLVRHVMERDAGVASSGGQGMDERARVMLVLIALSIVLSSVPLFNLLGNFPLFGHSGLLFLANALLLIVVYSELQKPASAGGLSFRRNSLLGNEL